MTIPSRLMMILLLVSLVAGCTTPTTGADTAMSSENVAELPHEALGEPVNASRCFVERDGKYVMVHVVIDSKAESISNLGILEGSAMLRTKACLRREFKDLPENFRIPARVRKNEFDDDTGHYYYTTAFKLEDINRRCGQ